MFVSIASNFTRLKIDTHRCIKNIVFATTFFRLVAGKKQLRIFLTLSPVLQTPGKVSLYLLKLSFYDFQGIKLNLAVQKTGGLAIFAYCIYYC